MVAALSWALFAGATEWAWRRRSASRARAWQLTALTLLVATDWANAPPRRGAGQTTTWRLPFGLLLATAGYPLGRMLAADRASAPPRDPFVADLVALSLMAVAEERTWAAHVQPVLGAVPTAILFGVKHALLDGRWRRVLGLALFFNGLALVHQHSTNAAMLVHVAANVAGVLLGHVRQRDQF